MKNTSENNIAALIHLSTLSQYCIPFGNYIFPILLWNAKKEESETIDFHGKQVLNFQLSWLLYSLILIMIAIPIFIFIVLNQVTWNAIVNNHEIILQNLSIDNNIFLITTGITALIILVTLKITEFFLIIYATIKASEGERYHYPLTISFIK
ncbi:DUF4870 domain-containing protein [Flavobacterium sp. NG2]|uniref:DUF4870 domain-containing protein n=1 Tax=Flavobacterium sp. NG2 TaxID=3097547 RepID=UPI002A7FC33B|nr:DUF4870 domain-containing protein [Flavobacterium sp. NG2]WPR71176.1 DUF4870 domain-containing protein [Flavobacterium sp. NG2]